MSPSFDQGGAPDNVEKQAAEHIARIKEQAGQARANAEAQGSPRPIAGRTIASGKDAMSALMSAVNSDDDTESESSFAAPPQEHERIRPVRQESRQPAAEAEEEDFVEPAPKRPEPPRQPQAGRASQEQSAAFNSILHRLREKSGSYNEVVLPSCGHFNPEIPGGVVQVRPLTARDELELAGSGQRVKRGGDALNRIFRACLHGNIDPNRLCAEDRFYLLIYLRGISFGTEYEVAIKCPECGNINKDKLDLDKDLFVMSLDQAAQSGDEEQSYRAKQLINHGSVEDKFPASGETFTWGILTGQMEAERDARSARINKVMGTDSKLLEHYSNFVHSIGGVTDPKMKQAIIRELPMADTSYLREIISGYTFGVDQNFEYTCQACAETFRTGLPIDETFFSTSKTRKR